MTTKRELKQLLFERQHGFCWLCGRAMNPVYRRKDPLAATFDHLTPVHFKGKFDPNNLLLAHQDCNSRRGHLLDCTWLDPPEALEPKAQWWKDSSKLLPFSRAWLVAKGYAK